MKLLTLFFKIPFYRDYMGKIRRNSKFHDWRPIFDNFRNRLLINKMAFRNKKKVFKSLTDNSRGIGFEKLLFATSCFCDFYCNREIHDINVLPKISCNKESWFTLFFLALTAIRIMRYRGNVTYYNNKESCFTLFFLALTAIRIMQNFVTYCHNG